MVAPIRECRSSEIARQIGPHDTMVGSGGAGAKEGPRRSAHEVGAAAKRFEMRRQMGRSPGGQHRERCSVRAMWVEEAHTRDGPEWRDVASANRVANEMGFDLCRRIQEQSVGAGLEPEVTRDAVTE